MTNKLDLTAWKEVLSTNESLQKKWKSLVTKKTEQEIFDIFTQHEYNFNFEWKESYNEYGTWQKKYYLDSSFRRAIAEITDMKKWRLYITETTIQKMIECIEWIQEAINSTKVYSNPKNEASFKLKSNDQWNPNNIQDGKQRDYKEEKLNNAYISWWEVYPPWTSDEYIENKEQKYWDAPLIGDNRETKKQGKERQQQENYEKLEQKWLIDSHWQTSIDFDFWE